MLKNPGQLAYIDYKTTKIKVSHFFFTALRSISLSLLANQPNGGTISMKKDYESKIPKQLIFIQKLRKHYKFGHTC